MANVTICGYARTNTGNQIALRTDSVPEGTETTITTDSNLTTTSQDLGTYKPGATVVSLEIFAPNGISYCYILRTGLVVAWGSVQVNGTQNSELMLNQPVVLRPGDTVRCLALTATARNVALCVYTASGTSRIFVGTPSGAGTTNLMDLQNTANNIGDTLQGQIITRATVTTVDAGKVVSSGSVWIRNASSQLAGAIPCSNPTKAEPAISMVAIPIALNFNASIVVNA